MHLPGTSVTHTQGFAKKGVKPDEEFKQNTMIVTDELPNGSRYAGDNKQQQSKDKFRRRIHHKNMSVK